ncbi:SpdD protein [Streptomyces sp. NPDC059076]|uniref:SpdD protein n=1 Tax=unclassified Streptomyces TaxID=2593676 RepID=UPI003676D26D
MLLRPKLPDAPPVPTGHVITSALPGMPASGCVCQHGPAASRRPLAPWVGPVAAAVGLGIVLTALLATVALTAVAVSIAALVLRSLLNSAHKR